jgi:hypothetical protein
LQGLSPQVPQHLCDLVAHLKAIFIAAGARGDPRFLAAVRLKRVAQAGAQGPQPLLRAKSRPMAKAFCAMTIGRELGARASNRTLAR